MERKYVNYEIEDRMAVVTINNPPVNSLTMELVDELSEVIKELNANDGVGTVIITGAGQKAFVAGANIKMIKDIIDNDKSAFEDVRRMQDCFTSIENLDKVVIAAINGLALGGGCELALACDIRVAAEDATLGVPEVKLGLIPGAGGTQRLARLLGKGKAKMLVLLGNPIGAREALNIGLVGKIVPAGEALHEAKKLAKTLLANAPLALRNGKKAINQGSDMTLEQGLMREADLVLDLFTTEDLKEGVSAFLEKRPPVFKGK